jgi:hypothetical protein
VVVIEEDPMILALDRFQSNLRSRCQPMIVTRPIQLAGAMTCILLNFITGCGSSGPNQSQPDYDPSKAAIESSMQSACSLMMKSVRNTEQEKKRWGYDVNMETFAQLKKIDISGCPPDFQAAFLKFAYTYQKAALFFKDYEGIMGGITVFAEGALKLVGAESPMEKRLTELQTESIDSVREVETACLKYGVDPERIYRAKDVRLLRAL